MVDISVVIPVLNESSLIEELTKRVKINVEKITPNFEIIIIDDGSKDDTWDKIIYEAKKEKRVKGIKFTRNFGHHYAITAGLHNTVGEWVIVMDGDLQDRPEVIPELYRKAQEGYEVVFVSRQNRTEKIYYKILQRIFYIILRFLSGVEYDSRQANFSIISRKVAEAFKNFPENARFYGSTVKWLGFSTTHIMADHGKRHSGQSAYTFKKRVKLAADIILSFSERPLKFAIGLGLIMSLLSIISVTTIIYRAVFSSYTVIGWASTISTILFSTGIILITTGISAIYIGEIFREVKRRPLYIVEKTFNQE